MQQATTLDELDARGLERCAHCKRPKLALWGILGAAALCAILIAGLDAVSATIKSHPPPFSWRTKEQTTQLLFNQQVILELPNRNREGDGVRLAALAYRLNGFFADVTPPPLKAILGGPGRAVVLAGDTQLLELSLSDTAGRSLSKRPASG